MYEIYTTIEKRPSEIRFSQDSIHHKFRRRSGHGEDNVNDTIDKILSGRLLATDLPRIEVAERDGELYTLGNRRLYMFRVLELKGKLKTIRVNVVSSLRRGLTTINDGVSIYMRNGGGTRDHAHAAPIPKPKEIVHKLLDELLLQVINSASQHTTNEAGTSMSVSKVVPDGSKAKSTDVVGKNSDDAIKTDGAISESSEGVVTTYHDVIISSDVAVVDAAVYEVCSDLNKSFEKVNKPNNLSDGDVETQNDDVAIRDDDVVTRDDDVVTKAHDVETQDDDVVTKNDNVETKVDGVVTKANDVETQVDDVETQVDDVETQVDDVVTKVDDVETKDVIPSFDSDANIFSVEKDRTSHQLGKRRHVELADTASAGEPEAKRSKT
uniref:Uncharacterized LOC100175021 n=1 Tax=Ciona intestinalis TaxID=7719 RepID=F6VRW5_CIOIN|nr:uncharacterized protein LOC100175021 isoform X2 [Ciona intestinalis]|eukprot:XP_002131378.1 uncharacterized protein LOC100175021 isoform X2 [Ciona intestinalis]